MALRSISVAVALSSLGAACAHLPPASKWPAECGAPIEGLDALVAPGRTLVLGEVHGAREPAAFAGDAVCKAAHAGPAVLGLEVPAQPQFEAYLASDGGLEAQRALLAAPFWTEPFQDGRRSVAMLGLVERLRALKRRGLPVDLLLFDAQPEHGQERDLLMAEKVAALHAQRPQAAYVLLMGNLHARKKTGSTWKPDDPYRWLAARLAWPVVSLDVGHGDGTAWLCLGPKPEECGPKGASATKSLGRRGVELAPSKDGAYDGVYDVGSFTASPPAALPETRPGH